MMKDMVKLKLVIESINDGNIITDVFPSKNNTYSDVLLPLSSYSGSTTISVANIKNVIKKYSPSARVNGLNKEKLLQLLEDIRKTNNITNADLCNKFADEIYLPKIVLKKADIPLSLRSQFIEDKRIIIASSVYMLIVLTTFRNTLVLFQIQYNYACY